MEVQASKPVLGYLFLTAHQQKVLQRSLMSKMTFIGLLSQLNLNIDNIAISLIIVFCS
jgi:hypothetical protein